MRFLSEIDSLSFFLFNILIFIGASAAILLYINSILNKLKFFSDADKKPYFFAAGLMLLGLCLIAIFPILAKHLKIITGAKYIIYEGWDASERFCRLEPVYLFDDAGLYVIVLTFVAAPAMMWKIYGKNHIAKLFSLLLIYLYFVYFYIILPFNFLVERKYISLREVPIAITEEQIRGKSCQHLDKDF